MSKSTPEAVLPSNNTTDHDDAIAPWQRLKLPRSPLVPDEILRRNNVYFERETRFKSSARLLQYLWLKDNGIPTGIHISRMSDSAVAMELGSCLSPEAARAGKNFLSPAIYALVRREVIMQEEGAAIDEDRLFGNALSSMPLVFNLFGPMVLDPSLATSVFRRLIPTFVHSVEHILFEHSPGRREERFLNDGTAFDLALRVVTPEGEQGTVYAEIKYTEDVFLGPGARPRSRYSEASRQVHLFKDPDSPGLRSLACDQFHREHMLAQLAVDHAVVSRAMFIVIGPRLNRRVNAAIRLYQNELIDVDDRDTNRVDFQAITLESVIEAMSEAGATDVARALWHRYADFQRILDISLLEFDANAEFLASTVAAIEPKNEAGQPKLPAVSSTDKRLSQSPTLPIGR
jgi:hypothetical protein